MISTKGFLVIFGLILIGSSFGEGKPRLFHLSIWKNGLKNDPNLFQNLGTTFKGFGNVNRRSFKSPGSLRNAEDEMLKYSISAFLVRKFLNKQSFADEDPYFDEFLTTKGWNFVSASILPQWGWGGNKIFSKLVLLSLQAKVLSMFRYSYAWKGVRLYSETEKRLGKSGIWTHDQQKTDFFIVICAIFNLNFLNTT